VTPAIEIRRARPEEQEALRQVAIDAKAFWGYELELVHEWAQELEPSARPGREVFVAEADGEVAGWAAVNEPRAGVAWLDDLWVRPRWIRRAGLGSLLFAHVLEWARAQGAQSLELEAEPNAVGFYAKLGCVHARERIGEWGRPLPVMALTL
jgi:GNAT superfamily N-acetyltransferase